MYYYLSYLILEVILNNKFIYEKKFMKLAINEAKKALAINEVPIGCVIVKDNKVIAKAYNKRIKEKSSLAHAEILAIKKACKKVNDWRLENCIMYITLEPCPMCAGAILQSRIPVVAIATKNQKAGAAGSIVDLFNLEKANHKISLILSDEEERKEASELLTSFFKNLRKTKIQAKFNL